MWNVEKLRKYLKYRGIVITGVTRKRNLISKLYYASWLHLQLCSTKEQEQAQIAARRKKKLLIDESRFHFQRIWQTGRQEVNISQIRRWLILQHMLVENPWILIQNDLLRSRVFKMIWANFSAFVHLETLPVRPSGPIPEHAWILAGPKSSCVWFCSEETCMVFNHILFRKSTIIIASKYGTTIAFCRFLSL